MLHLNVTDFDSNSSFPPRATFEATPGKATGGQAMTEVGGL